MSTQGREATLENLVARRQEIRRALTSVKQQILHTRQEVRVIRQQITSLSKDQRRAA